MNEQDVAARIAAIRGRLGAATPGPWQTRATAHTWFIALNGAKVTFENLTPDAALIVHAPADLAWCVEEIERLTLGARDDADVCDEALAQRDEARAALERVSRTLERQVDAYRDERDEARAALAELVEAMGTAVAPLDDLFDGIGPAWAEARRIVGEGGAL